MWAYESLLSSYCFSFLLLVFTSFFCKAYLKLFKIYFHDFCIEAHLQDQFAPREELFLNFLNLLRLTSSIRLLLTTFKLVTTFRWIIPGPTRWICSWSIILKYTVLLTKLFSMNMLSVNVSSPQNTTRWLFTETKSRNKNLRWMCMRRNFWANASRLWSLTDPILLTVKDWLVTCSLTRAL